MKNEGGSMASLVFFALGFVALIAGVVLYLVKEDQFSKRWAEQTKAIVAENEKLKADWQQAIDTVKGICENHTTLAEEMTRQKEQLNKIEFGIQTSRVKLPDTINFTVVERRRIVKEGPVTTVPLTNGAAGKPTPVEKKVIKKIKKQMKELSQ